MLRVSIKADIRRLTANLTDIAQRQIPFATARALNDLAFQVQRAERAAIAQVFRRPRPFTQRSVMVTKATKQSLTATVYVRPEVARYLDPFEYGGKHVLPGPRLFAPKKVALDSYGQMRRGAVGKLLQRPDVFAGTIAFRNSGQTVSGVWRRPPVGRRRDGTHGTKGALSANRDKATSAAGSRTGLQLLVRFGSAVEVNKSLEFRQRAREIVARSAMSTFRAAIEKATATAR